MRYDEFAVPMSTFGLPSREELIELRIWDCHYHGTDRMEEVMFYADRFGIEHVITLELFSTDYGERARDLPPEQEAHHRAVLETYQGRFSGFIRVDLADPELSLRRMERWIRNGPCVGIKFGHGFPGNVPPDHPNADPIMRLARELKAVVNIHSWIKVGGEPRRITGGNGIEEATPMTVAKLATRYPDLPIICGHSGGDWELGVRAIRPHKNVLFEFAGSDCHSGQVDYAVKELGADRIVWGAHGPSRSWATEMGKILDADLTKEERMLCFGRNIRRALEPIFREKGYPMVV